MSKTRTGRKALSLILALCMVFSIFAGLTITAGAAADDSWVGGESFDYAAGYTGTGFTWEADAHTLTLSGVNVTDESDHDSIKIAGDATVVLEGANYVIAAAEKSGLFCSGALTIKGGGTLELTSEVGSIGVKSNGAMTIESGYITVNDVVVGVKSDAGITVSGGYISATVSAAAVLATGNYSQTGGYVKADGNDNGVLVQSGTVTVSGGYLEASGKEADGTGIDADAITNSGGVIKAVGHTNGIFGNCSFTGGVTIAEGTGTGIGCKAIEGAIGDLAADGEKLFDNTGAIAVVGTDGCTGIATSDLKSVVVAKTITFPETGAALDGYYQATGSVSIPNTVAGGSYIESAAGVAVSSLTLGGEAEPSTLVCVNTGDSGAGISADGDSTIGSNDTLVGISANGAGVFLGDAESGSFRSGGNLIGVGAGSGEAANGIDAQSSSLIVNGGYVCGVGGAYGFKADVNSSLTTNDGYVTAFAAGTGGGLYSGMGCTVNGGSVTAIGGTTAYHGPEVAGKTVIAGATAAAPALAAVEYNSYVKSFTAGEMSDYATVLTINSIPAVFDARNGTAIVNSKPVDPAWGDYTFAGWYEKDTGAALTGAGEAGKTYYAKWTVGEDGDKITVRTSPLDCIAFSDSVANAAEGWSWDNSTKTLILNGATIDCSGVTDCCFAIKLPGSATIQLEGSSTVKAGKGRISDSDTDIYSRGIHGGDVSILGSGSLDVASRGTEYDSDETTYDSSGIIGQVTVGDFSDSPNVTITGGESDKYAYGINGSLTVNSGEVTVASGTLTGDGPPEASTKALFGELATFGIVKAGADKNSAAAQAAAVKYDLDAKYVNVSFVSASVSAYGNDGFILGAVGAALTGQTATITLTGTTFNAIAANTEWDANVDGVKAKVTSAIAAGADEAAVTFSGTPAEPSDDALTITIPADALASGSQLITAEDMGNACWSIESHSQKREYAADFTASPIGYWDAYGNETPEASPEENITDSGEGWAWYVEPTCKYEDTDEIYNAVEIDGKKYKTPVLVLSGVNIDTDEALALKLPDGATIVLKAGAVNTVKSTFPGDGSYTAGVTCVGALTIEGSGTLNATGGTAAGAHDSMGVHGSTGLTVNGGIVNGYGGDSAQNSAGISADGGVLTVNGGTVKGQGGTSTSEVDGEGSVGLYAVGNIAVTGGSATGNADEGSALSIGVFSEATVKITGGIVTGTGGTAAIASTTGITFPSGFAINTPSDGVVDWISDSMITVFAGEAPATSVTIGPMPVPFYDPPPAATVPVIVDGEEYNIGKAVTESGVTTVTIEQTELQKQLDSASETVVIPVTPGRNADTVVAQFVVANVDEMAEKEMTLSVQVDDVNYVMPAVAIDTDTLMKELGAADPAKVPVNVAIKELDEDDVTLENGELVLPPVEFEVKASYSGKSVEVETFDKYVQRVIGVPGGGVAGKITTAVVVESGKQRHVPTEVFQKDGKWYARINSLTNSVYALISNEKSFNDDDGKWFGAVATEMASRGILNGRGDGTFDGDADITRAEFAAILVRALGLPETGDASAFTDVGKDAWYYGAVGKAYEYGLVSGRGNGMFDPNAKITRQEAMQMLYNSSEIAPIQLLSGINPGLYEDLDSVADWAKDAAGFNLLNGIVKGSDGLIRPQDNISRAESATIILRLLQKAGLVDVRAEA